MAISTEAIDRIFTRLVSTYGRMFTDIYAGLDIGAVKTAWAHELQGFGNKEGLYSIAWALENMPERAPNAIQFRNLCRQAPKPESPKLPEPKADPDRVAAELAKLGSMNKQLRDEKPSDRLGWARRIVARQKAGARIAGGTLQIAKLALAKEAESVE